MNTRILNAGEEQVLAQLHTGVFDDPLDIARTREFLADPRHHLAIALDGDVIIGFASGVHYVHPDKPHAELWINEVGVAAAYHGRGVGKAVVQQLLERAVKLGCGEAWVACEQDNLAARRLYESVGGYAQSTQTVIYSFSLPGRDK